jgi:hypothetical protein
MRCLNCRYDVRGLAAARCPECGRAFDPADATTFAGPLPAWIARRYRRSGRVVCWIPVVCAAAGLLNDAIERDEGILMFLFFVASCAVTVTLFRVWLLLTVHRRLGRPDRDVRRRAARRLGTAVLGLVFTVFAAGGGGLVLRIIVSTPWIVPAARAAIQGGPGTCDPDSRWLGLLHVYSINSDGRDAVVWIRERGRTWTFSCSTSGWPQVEFDCPFSQVRY